jgi:5'-deoxynucleotidase YfbR-like HD superfamily hydrolase
MSNEYITLLNGDRWYFDGRNPLNAPIEAMLTALDHIGRFTGQTKVFYSVLQHSLNAYEVACDLSLDRTVRRAALVHDLHECLVGDVSSPLKRFMAERWTSGYQLAESMAKRAIASRFNVPEQDSPLVKEADRLCLMIEAVHLQPQVSNTEFCEWPIENAPVDWYRDKAKAWDNERRFERSGGTLELIKKFRNAMWECT